MALGVWLASLAVIVRLNEALTAYDAGALLVVVAWGCIGVRLGFRLDRGGRHVLANFVISALLLGLYAGVWELMR